MRDVTKEQLSEFEKWLDKKNNRKGKSNVKKKAAPKRKPIAKKPAATESEPAADKNARRRSRRIKRRTKQGFSEETRKLAHLRAEDLCENPLCRRRVPDLGGEHHCLPRSQYHKADRNDVWNCACICQDCHARVTSTKSEADKRLRRYFERRAYSLREYSDSQLERELAALDKALIDGTLDLVRTFEPLSDVSA